MRPLLFEEKPTILGGFVLRISVKIFDGPNLTEDGMIELIPGDPIHEM